MSKETTLSKEAFRDRELESVGTKKIHQQKELDISNHRKLLSETTNKLSKLTELLADVNTTQGNPSAL